MELNAAGLEIWYKPCSHAYENDVCTICGAKATLPLSYDDHYDVTGKACPKYYVENEDAWLQFKEDLLTYIDTNGIAKTEEIQ